MNKLASLLAGIGFGAGLMYFYDPTRGNRRRALIRDQVNSMANKTDDALDVAVEDLRNRTRGMLAEAMARVSNEGAPDWLIEERVRAELGRLGVHNKGLVVSSSGGQVTLTGPILADEVNQVMRHASRVNGVRTVQNQMEVHQDPDGISALQGEPIRRGNPENWSPSLRLIGGLGGGLMTVYGSLRKGLIGNAMRWAGVGLLARSVTNIDIKSLLGMDGAREAIRVQKAINIDAPVEKLYNFWLNFENFPRFMSHVRRVQDLGNGRSHWVVAGPAGTEVEWDAIVTRQVPNEMIAWESVAGEDVKSRGTVRFRPTPDGMTRVSVQMGYTPPAGVAGHAVAALFGKDPKQAMDDDLVRLKSLFEEGKTTVEGRTLTGQDLSGATS